MASHAEQLVEGLASFLHTTQQVAQEQLAIYSAARFLSSTAVDRFSSNFEKMMDDNVEFASKIAQELSASGHPVCVVHLGSIGVLAGLGFLRHEDKTSSYRIGVQWSPGVLPDTIPLDDAVHFQLRS